MSIFEQVTKSCEYVASQANWIRIDLANVLQYRERLRIGDYDNLQHDPEYHLLGQGNDSLIFFLLLDCINFGSGYFPHLPKDAGVSGYFTIAKRLTAYLKENGIPDPQVLAAMTAPKVRDIFRLDTNNKHMSELTSLFALAWSDLGHWVCTEYDGDYLGFLGRSASADEAIRRVLQMRLFRDISDYFGTEIHFLKRAQIMLQDMKMAEPNHPLLRFNDIDDLTVFADNVLPYVFRVEGLMICDPWLEKRIQGEELIASGSIEEIELRACSIHIADLIASSYREDQIPITNRALDFILWQRGQVLKKLSDIKRHRTRCVYY